MSEDGTTNASPMELLLGPEPEASVKPATPEALRAAFFPPELGYGSEIELRAETGGVLGAAAATGPFMTPDDAGEFYLSFQAGDEVRALSPPLTRDAALALFLRFLAGDDAFLDELPWTPAPPVRAIVRELRDRIRADARAYGGTLTREVAIAWAGYLAGLIEWDVLSVSEHAALCSLLPPVDDSPVTHILLGREDPDEA